MSEREVLSAILRGPRFACSLGGALVTIASIRGGVPLVHSAPGCAYQLTLGQILSSGYQDLGPSAASCIPSTRLCIDQVVRGGEDRLRMRLKATLDLVDGDFVAVMTGCTAELIGDDIKAIAKEYDSKEKPVLYLKTGGFRGNSLRGHEIALEGLADQLMEPPAKKEQGLVNVFGILPYQDLFWRGNLAEVRRVLERLGLKANMMFGHERYGIESWKKAPEAELNLLLSPWVGMEFVKKFEEKFGVPYIIYPGLPIGPIETSKLLRMVGERLSVDKDLLEKVIAEEEKEVYYYLDGALLINVDCGYQFNFAVIGESNLVIGVNKFLTNVMGYIPVLTIVTDNPPSKYRPAIMSELTNLNHGLSPEVIFEENCDNIWQATAKSEAELILGSSLDASVAEQLGAVHLSIACPAADRLVTNNTLCGYKGGPELLSHIITAVLAVKA